jgi:hypothetical protein
MYLNPSETEEEQLRDGRLTIVLLVFFLLLLLPFHHILIHKKQLFVHSCMQLDVRYDKQLYLRQEEILIQHSESLPLTYYPFFFLPLPINRADKDLLMTIKGVGPTLAETIVSHRQEFGPILNIVNLQAIHGIGRKRATALANELVFDIAE